MSHLKTAHDYGVKEALKACGYNSVESLQKEASELGLFNEQPKTASSIDNVLAALTQRR